MTSTYLCIKSEENDGEDQELTRLRRQINDERHIRNLAECRLRNQIERARVPQRIVNNYLVEIDEEEEMSAVIVNGMNGENSGNDEEPENKD